MRPTPRQDASMTEDVIDMPMATAPALVKTTTPLPDAVARRGVSEAQWRTLTTSLYPAAKPESVLMVLDYCAARKLDPLKRPCHIVPMEVKVGNTYEWRDVVLPGIYELRTTAHRTGQYLGHAKAVYGPEEKHAGVMAPTYCEFTVYRWNPAITQRAEFPVCVWFKEVVATKRDGQANQRWAKAPIQMLTKCAEAAALREAFPDELGGLYAEEEIDGQRAIDAPVIDAAKPVEQAPEKPEGYDRWLAKVIVSAGGGLEKLQDAWKLGTTAQKQYLRATELEAWEALKARAAQADAAENTAIDAEIAASEPA
jgi:phage recombination protein Bet